MANYAYAAMMATHHKGEKLGMKIVITTSFVSILLLTSTQANAGFWDAITQFFGTSEQQTQTTDQAQQNSPDLITTGMQLLPLLTQQLGVSTNQASGGLGAILQAAKVLMPGSDFNQVSSMIPGSNALLSAVPKVANNATNQGVMGSLVEMAGEQSETVRVGTQLVSQFDALGMNAAMIPKFAEVTQNYLGQSSNPGSSDLLSTALSSVLQ